MIAESAPMKEQAVGRVALIGDAIEVLYRVPQVGQRPPLASGDRIGTEQGAGRILAEFLGQIGHLIGREFAMIAPPTVVTQRLQAVLTIRCAPLHQTSAATGRDGLNKGNVIAEAIQPHGLKAQAGRAMGGLVLGRQQFIGLCFGQRKGSVCHTPIVRYLFDSSITLTHQASVS